MSFLHLWESLIQNFQLVLLHLIAIEGLYLNTEVISMGLLVVWNIAFAAIPGRKEDRTARKVKTHKQN